MQVEPYLFFDGRCEEAVEFYRTALGAEIIMLMRNNECPDPAMCIPGAEDKIMHCSFRVGDSMLFASDGRCKDQPAFQGFSLSISVQSEDEAQRLFTTLSEDGQVQMPLSKTFFSPLFGMTTDRFGVSWMVLVLE